MSASRTGCALRRGQRLKAPDEAMFDGGYMLGEQALAMGLIDGLSTVDELVRATRRRSRPPSSYRTQTAAPVAASPSARA